MPIQKNLASKSFLKFDTEAYKVLSNNAKLVYLAFIDVHPNTDPTDRYMAKKSGMGLNSEKHTALNLIGAPVSYLGHDSGGVLTNAILENPLSVLVFDEIEKAHPDVMKYFLQILDNAEITDGQGTKVSFENVIIIMTSNLGVKVQSVVGFTNSLNLSTSIDKAIKDYFSPEFINRLDATVTFNHLGSEIAMSIVEKFLQEIESKLEDKKIILEVSSCAKLKLSQLGYSKEMGARAMKRVITSEIKKPVSEEILYGKIKNGGFIHISTQEDIFLFSYSK